MVPQGDGGGRDTGRRALRPSARRLGAAVAASLLATAIVQGRAEAGPAARAAAQAGRDEPTTAPTLEPPAGVPAATEPQPPAAPSEAAPRRSEQLTVTATRAETRVEDAPASVAVLPRSALQATAAPTLDDALRQVAGFSLFRRSGSRYANPTTQGVSLRGLGASGASRALVLVDGVPINDPFGGWVYWARVPRLSLERLEVLRGGASDLYGSSALGGVVQAVTRPTTASGLDLEASFGALGSYEASASAAAQRGPWGARLSAEGFSTDGYVPVAPETRGPVDSESSSRHATATLAVERSFGESGRVFARAAGYGESRENGTPLQTNDTRVWSGALGADRGPWAVRAWGQTQAYRQAFSAVSADRSREELTRRQRVPATAFGGSLQRALPLGSRQRLLFGAELRSVSGTTRETAFSRSAPVSRLVAGGAERTAAVFLEDLFQVQPRLLLAASLRLDGWWHRRGRASTTALATAIESSTSFRDRGECAISPRLGLLFRAAPGLSVIAAGYGAFRGPTLNELYRSFRVGDTLTLANPELAAERLRGVEAGLLLARGGATLRATVFQAAIKDAVANVTVSATPSLVTRERRNVGRLRSRGLELEGELRLGSRGAFDAGYVLTDARVAAFAPDPTLEGRWVPQVPRHQLGVQLRYGGTASAQGGRSASPWRAALQARWTGRAYDDDRNEQPLDAGLQVDALVSRQLTRSLAAFVACENVLDAELVVARTPLPSLAAPRVLRAGFRSGG